MSDSGNYVDVKFNVGDVVEVDVRSVRPDGRPPKWELAVVRSVDPGVCMNIEWIDDLDNWVLSGKFFTFAINAVRHSLHARITTAVRRRHGEG